MKSNSCMLGIAIWREQININMYKYVYEKKYTKFVFHIKLEEKISQHMWLFSTSRTKIRSLQGQQQNLKGIILIENIQKCTYIVNRRWINCCSKFMLSMYCVPEISTEVSVLTSYPQLIQVQSSCAHTLLVLEFQF